MVILLIRIYLEPNSHSIGGRSSPLRPLGNIHDGDILNSGYCTNDDRLLLFSHMSESTQHSRIANYIHEIIAACQNDPTRLEVAAVNFTSLIQAMKLYSRAPRHYNAIFEEGESSAAQPGQATFAPAHPFGENPDLYKTPVIGPLEEMIGHKLKQKELAQLGKMLSDRTAIRLDRDTKRNRPKLLRWYSDHWDALGPVIQELVRTRAVPAKMDGVV
jgi:hypothetical protein